MTLNERSDVLQEAVAKSYSYYKNVHLIIRQKNLVVAGRGRGHLLMCCRVPKVI